MKEKDMFSLDISLFYSSLGSAGAGFLYHLWFFSNNWSVLYLIYGLLFLLLSVLCAFVSFLLYLHTPRNKGKKEGAGKFYKKVLVFSSAIFLLILMLEALLHFSYNVEDHIFLIYAFYLPAWFISPYLAGIFVNRFGGGFK